VRAVTIPRLFLACAFRPYVRIFPIHCHHHKSSQWHRFVTFMIACGLFVASFLARASPILRRDFIAVTGRVFSCQTIAFLSEKTCVLSGGLFASPTILCVLVYCVLTILILTPESVVNPKPRNIAKSILFVCVYVHCSWRLFCDKVQVETIATTLV
jgi:hypothetical protein